VHVFRVLLAVAGGREHLPDMDRAAALLARLCRGSLCATLSRAMVIGRRDGLWLCREARGLPAPLAPAAGMIWDGRFRIEGWPVPPGTTLAPRGRGEALRDGKTAPGGAPARLAATARAAEPALWRDGALLGGLAGNGLESLSAVPVVGPWARFLPSFDLASAGAAAALAGAPPFPAPPCLDGGPEPA
jgi:tRNA(Ile)-lysidine synthase